MAEPTTHNYIGATNIVYENVIYSDNEITIVECLYTSDILPKLRSVFNTKEYTKSNKIYITLTGELVGEAFLTARFIYDDAQQVISCSSSIDSYYVASGNSSYFKNKQISYSATTAFGKPAQTAKLSYAYGIAGATGSISITCNTAGAIS